MNQIHSSQELTRVTRPGGGLYLHIPFCQTLCAYCHFVRTAEHDAELRQQVVGAILSEFELRRRRCAVLRDGRRPVETVYVGGGTPSLLAPPLVGQLLAGTLGRLPQARSVEITVEANPENLTGELIDAWLAAGVTRLSLGVQSLDDEVLALLGRQCRSEVARQALQLACQHFGRVAADWIIGPGVSCRRLPAELREAVYLGVTHVSLYILELHPGTPLTAAVESGRIAMPSDAQIENTYLAAAAALSDLGLFQYEVSNFACPGHESRHNQRYWTGVPYLGLGPGAHGYWGRRRYANLGEVAEYLAAVDRGKLPEAWTDPLSRQSRRLERLMLGIRTRAGVNLNRLPAGALDLSAGIDAGWWRVEAGRVRLTGCGFLRIDSIVELLAQAVAGPEDRPSQDVLPPG